MDGYGRVLFQARDLWPNFISCVLVVREDVIEENRDWVQSLVDGIAASGKWLDTDMDHRMAASEAAARQYYHQDPRLLRYVLSKPPDRVTYVNLALAKEEFDKIEELALESGILDGPVGFNNYADTTFATEAGTMRAYDWEGPQ
jgi:NitT/TauT family transport system substrate-binding protein